MSEEKQPAIEPGVDTSEYKFANKAIKIIGSLIAVAVTLNYLAPETAEKVIPLIEQAIMAIAGVVGIYNVGRSVRKKDAGKTLALILCLCVVVLASGCSAIYVNDIYDENGNVRGRKMKASQLFSKHQNNLSTSLSADRYDVDWVSDQSGEAASDQFFKTLRFGMEMGAGYGAAAMLRRNDALAPVSVNQLGGLQGQPITAEQQAVMVNRDDLQKMVNERNALAKELEKKNAEVEGLNAALHAKEGEAE